MEENKDNKYKEEKVFFPVVDSHTHLLDYTEKQLQIILENARNMEVKHIMTCCCVENDFSKMETIMKHSKDNFIINSYGLHPWWLNDRSKNWLDVLRKQLESDPSSHLGEIGLDQLKYEQTPQEEQIDVFEQQLKLGMELDRVITIHCVRAQPEMFKVLKKYFQEPTEKKVNSYFNIINVNIIMHSYGGNKDMTKKYLKLHANIYFSLSQGIIKKPKEAQAIPLEKLLVETDGPHQLSQNEVLESGLFEEKDILINENELLPKIKNLNEPKYSHVMVNFLAKLHDKSIKDMSNIIFQNSLKVLKLLK